MELYPKFIIEDGNIIISKVVFHKEIAKDPTKVRGGGWFKWGESEEGKRMLILYGESHDFGRARFEDIVECIRSGNIYGDRRMYRNISEDFEFGYATGTETIDIKKYIRESETKEES
jgi:hypothetical protein